MSAAAFAFWSRPGSFRRHNSSRERGGAESYNGAESGRGGGQVRFFPLIRESPGFRERERMLFYYSSSLLLPPTCTPFPLPSLRSVYEGKRRGDPAPHTHTRLILSAAGLKVLKGGKRGVCVWKKKFFLGSEGGPLGATAIIVVAVCVCGREKGS